MKKTKTNERKDQRKNEKTVKPVTEKALTEVVGGALYTGYWE